MLPIVASSGIGIDSSAAIAMVVSGDPRVAHLSPRLTLIGNSDLEAELDVNYEFRDDYFIPFLQQCGHDLVVVSPQVTDMHGQPHSNLYDYYFAQGMVPSRQRRSCTDRFKIQRVRQLCREALPKDEVVEVLIGFDCTETHRAAGLRTYQEKDARKAGQRYRYVFPLIELGIDRLEACAVLMDLGLPVPRRSACFCCPWSKSQDWWEMSRRWPQLYQKSVEMEDNVLHVRGREVLLGSKPLRERPQPRVFKVPSEGVELFKLAQSYLGQITPAWPSQALCLAAQKIYGEHWLDALRLLKVGPKILNDPWQIYIRLEYCLELSGQMPPVISTLPCGAWEMAEEVALPSAGLVGPTV